MEGFLDQAMKALGSTSKLVWIDDYEFLKAHQIPEAVPFIIEEGLTLAALWLSRSLDRPTE